MSSLSEFEISDDDTESNACSNTISKPSTTSGRQSKKRRLQLMDIIDTVTDTVTQDSDDEHFSSDHDESTKSNQENTTAESVSIIYDN